MVLNPHASSWYPHSNHSSSPLQESVDGENPITPSMVSFYLPNHQFPYTASAACSMAYPIYFYYQYPDFQLYYQPVKVEIENDVMKKKKLLDNSEELKSLLGISTVHEPPKNARGSVPPGFKWGYFEEFRGRKLQQKPKISAEGAGPVKEFVPFCNYTTVMIKNIPNKYRRNSFMEFLDKCCLEYQLEYDFLYLPMDFKTGDNLGYAFVNFSNASHAKKMRQVFKGFKWGCFESSHGTYISKKIADTAWAKIQGKDELTRHFAKSSFSCDTSEYLPVVISPPRDGSTFATSSSFTTIGNLGCCSNFQSFKNQSYHH